MPHNLASPLVAATVPNITFGHASPPAVQGPILRDGLLWRQENYSAGKTIFGIIFVIAVTGLTAEIMIF
jgi:hypothetical protein